MAAKKQKTFEDQVFEALGGYRADLVKRKLNDRDLKHLISQLLIEWAQGRVKC